MECVVLLLVDNRVLMIAAVPHMASRAARPAKALFVADPKPVLSRVHDMQCITSKGLVCKLSAAVKPIIARSMANRFQVEEN